MDRKKAEYARRWERWCLRSLIKVPKTTVTGRTRSSKHHHKDYHRRVTAKMEANNVKPLHVKILEAIYDEAWRVKDGGLTEVDKIRETRSRIWWDGVNVGNQWSTRRKKGGP